jgi:hypothetical protein
MESVLRLAYAFWPLAVGYLVMYVFGLIMGMYAPWELTGLTFIAVVLAVAYTLHAHRVQRAIRDHDDPSHEALMEKLHDYRERRGF